MDNDNFVVGDNSRTSKPGEPTIEKSAGSNSHAEPRKDHRAPGQTARPRICRAMSQQRGDSGHESAPQEFVRLVGCRDPNARTTPWVRPAQLR